MFVNSKIVFLIILVLFITFQILIFGEFPPFKLIVYSDAIVNVEKIPVYFENCEYNSYLKKAICWVDWERFFKNSGKQYRKNLNLPKNDSMSFWVSITKNGILESWINCKNPVQSLFIFSTSQGINNYTDFNGSILDISKYSVPADIMTFNDPVRMNFLAKIASCFYGKLYRKGLIEFGPKDLSELFNKRWILFNYTNEYVNVLRLYIYYRELRDIDRNPSLRYIYSVRNRKWSPVIPKEDHQEVSPFTTKRFITIRLIGCKGAYTFVETMADVHSYGMVELYDLKGTNDPINLMNNLNWGVYFNDELKSYEIFSENKWGLNVWIPNIVPQKIKLVTHYSLGVSFAGISVAVFGNIIVSRLFEYPTYGSNRSIFLMTIKPGKNIGIALRNSPPEIPHSPSPGDGSFGIPLNVKLNWTSKDPDENRVFYDLYFGTSSHPELIARNLSKPYFIVENLRFGTIYYWKVVAKDEYGAIAEGPVWKFRTQSAEQLRVYPFLIGDEYDNYGFDLVQTEGGDYIIIGSTRTYGSDYEKNIIYKIGKYGEVKKMKVIGKFSGRFSSIVRLNDGNYIIIGNMEYNHRGVIWLGKIDNNLNLLWSKIICVDIETCDKVCLESLSMLASYAIPVRTGGFVIVGTIEKTLNDYDTVILRFDNEGNKLWIKTYGSYGNDIPNAIINDKDSGFMIVGSKFICDFEKCGDYPWMLKLNYMGELIWEKVFSDDGEGTLISITQLDDYGYVMVGTIESSNFGDNILIIRTNSYGRINWVKVLAGNMDERALSVIKLNSNNNLIVAVTNSNSGEIISEFGNEDIVLLKMTNNEGQILWKKIIGGAGNDVPTRMFKLKDGYLILGYTDSKQVNSILNNGKTDILILRGSDKVPVYW